ncbi:hypothetical protein ABK040_013071 [Willaertia magna]
MKKKGSRAVKSSLPKEARDILKNWFNEHFSNPYPTENEKKELSSSTGLTLQQVNNWFVNARVRKWRPALQKQNGSNSSDVNNNNNSNFEELKGGDEYQRNDDNLELDHQHSDSGHDLQDFNSKLSPRGARGTLPKEAVEHLKNWLFIHFQHPYPSEAEKAQLAEETDLTLTQVNNWFINARRRLWKPIIEKQSQKGTVTFITSNIVSPTTSAFELQQQQGNNGSVIGSFASPPSLSSLSVSGNSGSSNNKKKETALSKAVNDFANFQENISIRGKFENLPDSGENKKVLLKQIVEVEQQNIVLRDEFADISDKYSKLLNSFTDLSEHLGTKIVSLEKAQEELKRKNTEISKVLLTEKEEKKSIDGFSIESMKADETKLGLIEKEMPTGSDYVNFIIFGEIGETKRRKLMKEGNHSIASTMLVSSVPAYTKDNVTTPTENNTNLSRRKKKK